MPVQQRHLPSKLPDLLGTSVSLLCLAHCLLLPLILAMAPSLAIALGMSEEWHVILFLIAVPVSGLAIIAGARRHGSAVPVILGAAGLVGLGLGAFSGFPELTEVGVTVIGSLLLVAAHWSNLRRRSAR